MWECSIGSNSDVLVDPSVSTKANGIRYCKIKTSIPVDDDQDVDDDFAYSEGVREICSCFCFIKEFTDSRHPGNCANVSYAQLK